MRTEGYFYAQYKKGGLLPLWLRKQLKDFFKMEVTSYTGETKRGRRVKATLGYWQDLQLHCKKEVIKCSEFKEQNKKWIAYYTELGRICDSKIKKEA